LLIVDATVEIMPRPQKSKPFQDYSSDIFRPYVQSMFVTVSGIYLVRDQYISKFESHSTTKRGIVVKVLPETLIPTDWETFLRYADNKTV